MVALRKPEDLDPPPRDGLATRPIPGHSTQKTHYLCRYAETAATATKKAFYGKRTYADLYAAYGVCENKDTHELSWGSALLALQVTAPYDLYFLNDLNEDATGVLAQRVKNLGIPGAAVFELDLRRPDAFARARDIANVVTAFGPKIVVSTGDADEAPFFLRELLRPFGKRRYLLSFIDPLSATFHWRAFVTHAIDERAMDVISLYPDRMDLGRNFTYYLNNAKAGAKLDAYFECEWREVVKRNPQRAEHELRVLYEQRMTTLLGFKIGHPKGVGFTKRPLYHLVFGSKSDFGMELWNRVNRRTPWDQDELFLDGA